MKILIIDDDPSIVDIWSIILQKEGYEIITAATGKDGLTLAKKEMPQLVLLDQIMPDMKGNDVLQILKEDPETKAIPVALVSNYSESELAQEAIKQGAADYIFKFQIEPQDLATKVKTLLQEANSAQQ